MSALLTTRFQMIELPVGTQALGVGSRLKIPDQPQLRTQTNQVIVIQALRSYDAVATPNTPTGAVTASVAAVAAAFLVLNVAGTDTNLFIPLTDLVITATTDTAVQRAYNNTLYRLNNITKVDWSKSYLQLGAAVAANQSYLIGVHYFVVPDDTYVTAPTPLEMPIVS